jgi:hypothetical protein
MTLVMTAVAITTLLALSALAIDLGMLYTARTSAQHAADAAALAGAYTFAEPPTADPAATARTAAKNIAGKNPILRTFPTLTDADVDVDLANRRVTVRVPRTGTNGIPLYFARIFGNSTSNVQAIATAECGTTAVGVSCLKPIYLPNTIISDKDPAVACGAAKEFIFNPDHTITPFAQSRLGSWSNVRPTTPSDALQPGQFFSLDFGSGADAYRCALGKCLNDCGIDTTVIRCDQALPLKTGDMVGPTKQGVEDLLGDAPDQWVDLGKYLRADGKIYDSSDQLVVAPVWDNCTQKITSGTNGQTVTVVGFIQIFVEKFQNGKNGGIRARFVSPIKCSTDGNSEGNQFGANTSPVALPIRLVKTP